jgi:hypothetical protein
MICYFTGKFLKFFAKKRNFSMFRWVFLGALVFWALTFQAEEPWSRNDFHPVFGSKQGKSFGTGNEYKKKSFSWLSFYQEYISSFDGPRCSMAPTCSAYAAESLENYGFVQGLLMICDRLFHEAGKMDFFYLKKIDNRLYFDDPPEKNHLW